MKIVAVSKKIYFFIYKCLKLSLHSIQNIFMLACYPLFSYHLSSVWEIIIILFALWFVDNMTSIKHCFKWLKFFLYQGFYFNYFTWCKIIQLIDSFVHNLYLQFWLRGFYSFIENWEIFVWFVYALLYKPDSQHRSLGMFWCGQFVLGPFVNLYSRGCLSNLDNSRILSMILWIYTHGNRKTKISVKKNKHC